MSIPSPPLPIPCGAQRALSIPLIIFLLAPLAPPQKPKIPFKNEQKHKIQVNPGPIRTSIDSKPTTAHSRSSSTSSIDSTNYSSSSSPCSPQKPKITFKNEQKHKIQVNPGPIRICVDSKSTTADSLWSSTSSIDSTNYFSSSPPCSPTKAQNTVQKRTKAQNSGKPWSDSHMCRFQLHHCRFPGGAQRALSIPLIIFFSRPRSPRTKTKIPSKKRTKTPKIEINPGPIRTCVDSNSTTADCRSSSTSSIDSTNYFSSSPPCSPTKAQNTVQKRTKAQNSGKPWSDSHMCRFQVYHCRFQVELHELYRFH